MTNIEVLRQVRASLQDNLDRIDQLIGTLSNEEDGPQGFKVPDGLASEQFRTVAIERVLEANHDLRTPGRPVGAMRPTEIRSVLGGVGRSDPPMEVQVTTFDLAQRDRIEKVGRGLYRTKRPTSGNGRAKSDRELLSPIFRDRCVAATNRPKNTSMEDVNRELEEVMVPIVLDLIDRKGCEWTAFVLPEYAGMFQGLPPFEGDGYRVLRAALNQMRAAGCKGVTWYD